MKKIYRVILRLLFIFPLMMLTHIIYALIFAINPVAYRRVLFLYLLKLLNNDYKEMERVIKAKEEKKAR